MLAGQHDSVQWASPWRLRTMLSGRPVGRGAPSGRRSSSGDFDGPVPIGACDGRLRRGCLLT
jgi:hypothetical protein